MAAPRIWAVIPAAGSGSRMKAKVPKQYLTLAGEPVIRHVLRAFDRHPRIAGIVVAVADGDAQWGTLQPNLGKPVERVNGGATRMQSVINGLAHLTRQAGGDDWVMVHDAARPCLTQGDLDRLIEALRYDPVGGLLGVPITDTVKRVDEDERVAATLDRAHLWRAFTPQMFRFGALYEALRDAVAHDCEVTDEASAMERMGHSPRMVAGRPDNIKITHPDDLALAEFYLKHL